jgi:hypothetical protein
MVKAALEKRGFRDVNEANIVHARVRFVRIGVLHAKNVEGGSNGGLVHEIAPLIDGTAVVVTIEGDGDVLVKGGKAIVKFLGSPGVDDSQVVLPVRGDLRIVVQRGMVGLIDVLRNTEGRMIKDIRGTHHNGIADAINDDGERVTRRVHRCHEQSAVDKHKWIHQVIQYATKDLLVLNRRKVGVHDVPDDSAHGIKDCASDDLLVESLKVARKDAVRPVPILVVD